MHRRRLHSKHLAFFLITIAFLFTLHYTLGVYINSSFLEEFIDVKYVGVPFTVAAVLALLILFQIEHLLITFGDIKVMIALFFINLGAYIGIVYASLSEAIPAFIPVLALTLHYMTAVFLIRFAFDVYVENKMNHHNMGLERGKLLTATNVAWLLSPFIFSFFLENTEFWKVYTLSLSIAVLLMIVAGLHLPALLRDREPRYKRVFFREAVRIMWRRRDLARITFAALFLQMFFALTIIYLPIHLRENLFFSWQHIGLLLAIMLVPYVLVDIPLGYLADKYWGERELLSLGFLVTFIAFLPVAFITAPHFLLWAVILFLSRLGAAMVEIMTETYFFKKVAASDGSLISLYRSAQPFAYVFAPTLATFMLAWLGLALPHLFLTLALMMLCGLIFSLPLRDTKPSLR